MAKTENTELILAGKVPEILGIQLKVAKKLMQAPNGIRSCFIKTQLKTTRAEVSRFMDAAISGQVSIPDLIRPVPAQIRTKPVTKDRLQLITTQFINSRKDSKNEMVKKSA